jgi:hypothetical protein
VPFLRFDAAGQERFDGWRADLEQRLRAEDDHPVLLSHLAKYRSLMLALALILHVIDGVDAVPADQCLGWRHAVSGATDEPPCDRCRRATPGGEPLRINALFKDFASSH